MLQMTKTRLSVFIMNMQYCRPSHSKCVREACNLTPVGLCISMWAKPLLEATDDLKKCLGNTFRHIYYNKMVSGCDASPPFARTIELCFTESTR